jgi:hypothetical protein
MAAVAGMAVAFPAMAGQVFINPDSKVVATETGSRAEAKYRLASTNFDQSLGNSFGTSSGGANFISNGLGNGNALNNVWFRFSLQHVAGQGYTMRMVNHGNNQNNEAGASHTLIWRDDAATVNNGETLKSRSSLNGQTATGQGAVKILILTAQATSTGGSMEWDQLSFSASGQTVVGTLGDMNAPPTSTQRIVSTSDFRSFDWSLEGWVRGAVATGGGEQQRFTVNMKDGDVTVIPLPTTAGLAGLGMLLVAGSRRRLR